MVQLRILSGKKAGAVWSARRFPVRLGRAAACDLRLDEPGVWDEHLQLALRPGTGVVLETRPEAWVTLNGSPVQKAVLRNGDVLEIGALKMRFWLGEIGQRRLRSAEALVWALVLAVALGQAALMWWLPR